MSKVRYYIQEPNTAGESKIFLNFSYYGKRLRYYTGHRIPSKYWNSDKQRAKESRQFPQYPELNAFLNNLEHETQTILRRNVNDGKTPSIVQFKDELNAFLLRGSVVSDNSLFGFIENLIKEREQLPRFSPGLILIYKRTLRLLNEFATSKRKKLDFNDIDLDFFADFQSYLYNPPLSYAQSTAQCTVKTLKTFLNEATERGINKNLAYQSKRFNIKRTGAQSIYLTTEELSTLYHLDLTQNKRLEKVRDLFLIGAYTGLRFSDFSNLKPENIRTIEGSEFIQMNTKKTGENVVIPINPIVRAILDKYGGKPPKANSNQKMNQYLKELAKLAGFNEPIVHTTTKGGERIFKKNDNGDIPQKWELVTTHTARRSFATNAYKAGIPAISIMKITGHRTEKAFMRYIKISKEENALLIAHNDFFKISPLKAII